MRFLTSHRKGILFRPLKVNPKRFFSTFLDNCLVFLFQKPPSKGPIGVVWDVSSRCNLKCISCDLWKVEKKGLLSDRPELDTKQRLEIITALSNTGVWLLSFCSAEPLLSGDLGLLIKQAKKEGMVVNISTNGLLLEEMAEVLIDSGVDSITVSIYSHDAKIHDELRAYRGLFDKVKEGIGKVRELSKNRRIYIEIRCLVNKLNFLSLHDFVEFWDKSVDSITFIPTYSNSLVFYSVPSIMQFQPEDELKFRSYFSSFLKKHRNFDNVYDRHIPDFIFNPDSLKDKFLCFAGTFFAGVDCAGNLYPCRELTALPNEPLGNLLETDFMNLWRTDKLKELRYTFKQGLRCNCWMDRSFYNIALERLLMPLDRLLRHCSFKFKSKTKQNEEDFNY